MKVYTKIVIDIDSGQVLEEQSFEYEGPVALCYESGGGNSPESEGEADAAAGGSGGSRGGDSDFSRTPYSDKYGTKTTKGGNLSDVTKAMLSSPSAQAYNDYYASKLGVLGTPGATWSDFGKSLTDLGSYWGNTASWGLQSMVDKVSSLPDTIAKALGLSKAPATVDTAFGPMSTDMASLPADLPEVDAAKLGMAVTNLGRMPTDDEINMVAGVMADKGLLGPVDMAGMKLANATGNIVGQAASPMAAFGAAKAGLDLTNPVTQKAMGIGIDTFGNMISRAINTQTIAERASGTGIAAGKVGTMAGEAQSMSEAAGRGGSERQGDLGGAGKIDAFNAFLNQGGFTDTTSRGRPSASGSGNVNTGGSQKEGAAPPPPMAKRQRGSRLGLSDYMTLTNNLGAGSESTELRNRMLGGA
jgi:hypothetical protein